MLTIQQLEQNIWNVNLLQLTSTREIIHSYRLFFISFYKSPFIFHFVS